jgi:hypothetical protein
VAGLLHSLTAYTRFSSIKPVLALYILLVALAPLRWSKTTWEYTDASAAALVQVELDVAALALQTAQQQLEQQLQAAFAAQEIVGVQCTVTLEEQESDVVVQAVLVQAQADVSHEAVEKIIEQVFAWPVTVVWAQEGENDAHKQ